MTECLYSTKEVCELFDIKRDTLRHYEDIKLLIPYEIQSNNYRKYSRANIDTLIDIRKYRALEFSLENIRSALYESDYSVIADHINEHVKFYSEQLIKYTLLRKKAMSDLNYIRLITSHLSVITETDTLDLFFIPFVTNSKSPYFSDLKAALNNLQFFTSAMISGEGLPKDYGFGLITEKKFSDFLGLTNGIVIPGTKVVGKIVDYTHGGGLNNHLLMILKTLLQLCTTAPSTKSIPSCSHAFTIKIIRNINITLSL